LKVIQQATANNARILGQEQHLGRVRAGYLADVLVVNGNPLEDLKVLYPTGVDVVHDGKVVHGGGVEWTIKDGIPYSAPAMLARVKEIVAQATSADSHQ
jgi:cytosine/adenosine deaminase-related metal-dependent hydrolase